MNFEDLTPEEQTAYLNFMLLIRPLVGKFANVNLWITQLTTLWTSEISDIHNQLSANAVVPDNTGYPNASALTKSEITSVLSLMATLKGLSTSELDTIAIKCVGPENIMGG